MIGLHGVFQLATLVDTRGIHEASRGWFVVSRMHQSPALRTCTKDWLFIESSTCIVGFVTQTFASVSGHYLHCTSPCVLEVDRILASECPAADSVSISTDIRFEKMQKDQTIAAQFQRQSHSRSTGKRSSTDLPRDKSVAGKAKKSTPGADSSCTGVLR